MSDYLTIAAVLAIHVDLIEQFGRSQGIRDLGALEAALFRRQTGCYDHLAAEAASRCESLSQTHPFIDGNKWVAFTVADVFLAINGLTIVLDPLDAFAFIDGLHQAGTFCFDRLDPWLRPHLR